MVMIDGFHQMMINILIKLISLMVEAIHTFLKNNSIGQANPMSYKKIRILVAICLALWLSTLGIHKTTYTRTVSDTNSGDAWEAYASGDEPFCGIVWIGGGAKRKVGIPFVFQQEYKQAPFSMNFSIVMAPDEPFDSISINKIEIYNGEDRKQINENKSVMAPFVRNFNESMRADISIPDVIDSNQSFNVRITGVLEGATNELEFATTIRVMMMQDSTW